MARQVLNRKKNYPTFGLHSSAPNELVELVTWRARPLTSPSPPPPERYLPAAA